MDFAKFGDYKTEQAKMRQVLQDILGTEIEAGAMSLGYKLPGVDGTLAKYILIMPPGKQNPFYCSALIGTMLNGGSNITRQMTEFYREKGITPEHFIELVNAHTHRRDAPLAGRQIYVTEKS